MAAVVNPGVPPLSSRQPCRVCANTSDNTLHTAREMMFGYSSGVRVLRKHVAELDGAFDFIMLHHSFEHMPDPLPTLQKRYSLLKPDRYVLISMFSPDDIRWFRARAAELNALQDGDQACFYLYKHKSTE